MGVSTKWVSAGVLGLTTCLGLAGTMPAGAVMSHDGHIAVDHNAEVATPVSIFTAIAEFANSNEANLVVMGTHGMKGMQKLTGSWALKVIVKSKVPFIVVQDPPSDQERYHYIVFPVDFRNENKEKMKMTIFMGKYFDSKIHIIKIVTNDKSLARKINVNMNFAIKYLIQNNIEYEFHDMPHGKFAQHTIDFAQ